MYQGYKVDFRAVQLNYILSNSKGCFLNRFHRVSDFV